MPLLRVAAVGAPFVARRVSGQMTRHVLLTGVPGCGKTTVIMAVLRQLRETDRPVFGFWTEEIREGGARQGFALELVSGARETLALARRPGPPRVGRYGVNVEAMDRLVVPEIARAIATASSSPGVVLVMDEIGRMELFSAQFREAVLSAFDSPARVLATIMARAHPFADSLKQRPDVTLLTVRPENREKVTAQIVEMLAAAA